MQRWFDFFATNCFQMPLDQIIRKYLQILFTTRSLSTMLTRFLCCQMCENPPNLTAGFYWFWPFIYLLIFTFQRPTGMEWLWSCWGRSDSHSTSGWQHFRGHAWGILCRHRNLLRSNELELICCRLVLWRGRFDITVILTIFKFPPKYKNMA